MSPRTRVGKHGSRFSSKNTVSSTHRFFRIKSDKIAAKRRLYPSPKERKPCGAFVYRQRPNGVIKVVR